MRKIYIIISIVFIFCFISTETKAKNLFGTIDSTKNFHVDFMAGIYNPVGKLTEIMGPGAYIGMRFSSPVSRQYGLSIDCGMDFIIPGRKNPFEYYEYSSLNNGEMTESELLFELNLFFRKSTWVAKNTYWNKYIGVGYHALLTDLSRDRMDTYYDPDYGFYSETVYEGLTVGVAAFTAGTAVFHNRLGVFVEVKYTPYHKSEHIKGYMGAMSILSGISFRL